jgi:hypothetical protein
MAIDKKIKYDMQGGVKNYLGKQKQVKAPLKWQSSPDHPTTELAYITQAEKDLLVKKDLHGSLKGGVNRGPSGIMSLNGFGSNDESQNVSGSQMSAAETGNFSGFSGTGTGTQLPPGVTKKDPTAQDIRSAFINAGAGQRVNPSFFDSRNVISPAELAMAEATRNDPNNLYGSGAYKKTRGSGIMDFIKSGGFTGAGIRGLGQRFGLGKKYNEPTYDMSEFNNLGLDGVNPASLDFNPDAKISNTSFTQEPDELRPYPQIFEFDPTKFNTKNVATVNSLDEIDNQVAELTDQQKDFINSKKFALRENLINAEDVFNTITNPDLNIYDDGIMGFNEQEPTTLEEYNNYLQSLGINQRIV